MMTSNLSSSTKPRTITTGKSVLITTTDDVNYWLVVGTPIIVTLILVFIILIVLRIYLQKRKGYTSWRYMFNCTKQEEEYEKPACFDNTIYGEVLALDVNSPLHSPTDVEFKPPLHLLDRRKRSTSCPAMTEFQISKVSIQYEKIESPTKEGPLYIYVDPSKFMDKIEEVRRYRSENDVSFLQVHTGSSQEKFQHCSLIRLNPGADVSAQEKFASYVKVDGADSIYKIPSSVPKFDPPRSQPPKIPTRGTQEEDYTDMNISNKSPEPPTIFPKPASRSPKPAHRSPKPVTRSPKPTTRSPKQTNNIPEINIGEYESLCGNTDEYESPHVTAECTYIDMNGLCQINTEQSPKENNSVYAPLCVNIGEYESLHSNAKSTYVDKNGLVQINTEQVIYQGLPAYEGETYHSLLENNNQIVSL